MKKQWMKIITLVFVLVMVVAGCKQVPETSVKEDSMSDQEVMKDEDMAEDDMSEDSMKDDMTDKDGMMDEDTMEDEDMSEEGSHDDMMDDEDMTEDTMDDSMDKDSMEDDMMMTNEGPMAPELTFTDFDGNTITSADLKGQKVYLKYWASWCSICLAGLEEVDELFASDPDFTLYTVVTPGANGEQSREDFIEWFEGLGYDNILVLFDEKGMSGKELNIRAFPTSVYIGSDGVLIEALPGHKSNDQILDKIDSFY